MNTEEINNKIRAEKDNYNMKLNRLQQEILKLKSRHQQIIANLQNQKQQCMKNKLVERLCELIKQAER